MPTLSFSRNRIVGLLQKISFIGGMAILSLGTVDSAFAQVDAGVLQQGLEKQLPMPSPLALPGSTTRESLTPSPPKQGDVTFEVKSFVVEGANILLEASVQDVLKPIVIAAN